ncbi:flippase [Halosegnis marinus]|uniref:flippase n=1 Tax=Halosegnis marinus TaxID=3034023 RepID=UPI00360D810D
MVSIDDSVRKLFKGGGILLFGLLLQLGISFVGKLIVARELSVADFGGVVLGTTVAMIAATAAQLGLHEGVARYLPRFDTAAEKRGVVLSAASLAVPISVVFGVALYLISPTLSRVAFDSPEVAPVFRVFSFVVPLMVTHQLIIGVVQGQQRTTPKVLIENTAKPVARIAAIGIVVAVGATGLRISLAYLFGWVVPVLFGLGYLYVYTNVPDRTVGAVFRHRELLSFSMPLVLSGVLTIVFNDIDTLLLGYFSGGTEQVALYNAVYPLATLLNTATTAFAFVFMPVLSEIHADGRENEMERMYQVVTKWVFTATLPVFLVISLFPARLIALTFGAKYTAGATTLQVLAIGFFVHTVAGLNRETAASIGRSKMLLYADAGAAIFNMALNIALIPRYGPLVQVSQPRRRTSF